MYIILFWQFFFNAVFLRLPIIVITLVTQMNILYSLFIYVVYNVYQRGSLLSHIAHRHNLMVFFSSPFSSFWVCLHAKMQNPR